MLNLTVYADTAANAEQILLGKIPRDANGDVRRAVGRLVSFVEWPGFPWQASTIRGIDGVVLEYHVSFLRFEPGHGVCLHVCDNGSPKC